MSEIKDCPTCGSKVTVEGDESTYFYRPVESIAKIVAECFFEALERLAAQGPIRLPNGYEVIAPGQLPSWVKRIFLKSTYPGSSVPEVDIYDLPGEDTEDVYDHLEDDINEGRVRPINGWSLYRNTLENK